MAGHDISDYSDADRGAVLGFFADVLAEVGFGFDPGGRHADLGRIPEVYQVGGGCFLLARDGGRVVGTVGLRPLDGETGELKRFFVRAEYRGRGVGTALLDQALAHARAGAWGSMRLDTSSKSPVAIAMFRRRGFVEIPRYNDDPFAELFMELRTR